MYATPIYCWKPAERTAYKSGVGRFLEEEILLLFFFRCFFFVFVRFSCCFRLLAVSLFCFLSPSYSPCLMHARDNLWFFEPFGYSIVQKFLRRSMKDLKGSAEFTIFGKSSTYHEIISVTLGSMPPWMLLSIQCISSSVWYPDTEVFQKLWLRTSTGFSGARGPLDSVWPRMYFSFGSVTENKASNAWKP